MVYPLILHQLSSSLSSCRVVWTSLAKSWKTTSCESWEPLARDSHLIAPRIFSWTPSSSSHCHYFSSLTLSTRLMSGSALPCFSAVQPRYTLVPKDLVRVRNSWIPLNFLTKGLSSVSGDQRNIAALTGPTAAASVEPFPHISMTAIMSPYRFSYSGAAAGSLSALSISCTVLQLYPGNETWHCSSGTRKKGMLLPPCLSPRNFELAHPTNNAR